MAGLLCGAMSVVNYVDTNPEFEFVVSCESSFFPVLEAQACSVLFRMILVLYVASCRPGVLWRFWHPSMYIAAVILVDKWATQKNASHLDGGGNVLRSENFEDSDSWFKGAETINRETILSCSFSPPRSLI